MIFDTWDILLNVLIMLFWFRIWTRDSRDSVFNPHYAPIWRISESIMSHLRPALLGAPTRLVALLAVIFLICFKGIVFHGLAIQSPNTALWTIRLGFHHRELQQPDGNALIYILFSAVSFGIFLFKLWSVSLFYTRPRLGEGPQTSDALHLISEPFSNIPIQLRPPALLLYGLALTLLFNTPDPDGALLQTTTLEGIKSCLSVLVGWVQVLGIIMNFAILLIIGSWVSMFAASESILFFSREWLNLLLGPLRRMPLQLGFIDLTPLVFILALQFTQGILLAILTISYKAL